MKSVETKPRWGVIKRDDDGINVELFAEINHKTYRVYGYGLGVNHQQLAERLVRAWKAKAFAKRLTVKPCDPVAAPGQFWVDRSGYMPLVRKLNAELRRLGF